MGVPGIRAEGDGVAQCLGGGSEASQGGGPTWLLGGSKYKSPQHMINEKNALICIYGGR